MDFAAPLGRPVRRRAGPRPCPSREETTGIAFHYDAPGARPPQAVLLAVPPAATDPAWSVEALLDTVIEAHDLARIRAVGPRQLEWLGHHAAGARICPTRSPRRADGEPDGPRGQVRGSERRHRVDPREGLSDARLRRHRRRSHPDAPRTDAGRRRRSTPGRASSRCRCRPTCSPRSRPPIADPLLAALPPVAVPRVRRRGRRHADRGARRGRGAPLSRYLAGPLGADAATRARDYSRRRAAARGRRSRPSRCARCTRGSPSRPGCTCSGCSPPACTRCATRFVAALPARPSPAGDGRRRPARRRVAGACARPRARRPRSLLAALAPLRDATGRSPRCRRRRPSRRRRRPRRSTCSALARVVRRRARRHAAPSAWNPHRLEYAFAASARRQRGEVIARRRRVRRRHARLVLGRRAPRRRSARRRRRRPPIAARAPTLPTPVEYPGKPADRFWEFEDAGVHFGAIDAGPTDLARLLLVEFALVYGNDWFVVPVAPAGRLAVPRHQLHGARHLRRRHAGHARRATATARRGRCSSLPRRRRRRRLAISSSCRPTLAQTIDGEPIEQVALFRDEMANMAWGVERRVPGVSGDAYDRVDEASRRAAQQQVSGPPVDAQLVYRLATSVPEHWIPFVPVPARRQQPGDQSRHPAGAPRAPAHRDATASAAPAIPGASCSAPTPPGGRRRAAAAHRGGGGPARGGHRRTRLPVRALVRRPRAALARPPQDRRPRRGLERAALRHARPLILFLDRGASGGGSGACLLAKSIRRARVLSKTWAWRRSMSSSSRISR